MNILPWIFACSSKIPVLAGIFLGWFVCFLDYTEFQSIMLPLQNSIKNLQLSLRQQRKLMKNFGWTTDKQQRMFFYPTFFIFEQQHPVSKSNSINKTHCLLTNKSCPHGYQRNYLKCRDKKELLIKQDNYTKTSKSVNCIMNQMESSLTFC